MSPKPPGAMGSPYGGESLKEMLKTSLDNVYDYDNSFNNHRTTPQEIPKTAEERAAEEKLKAEAKAKEEAVQQQKEENKPTISVRSKDDNDIPEAKASSVVLNAIENQGTFEQNLKNELVQIVIENNMSIIEVTDKKIVFEYKNKKFLFIPV